MEDEMSALLLRPSYKQKQILTTGFSLLAIYGLLIAIITVIGQIAWHIEGSQFSVFELEICFGIYGLFLASTSYYLSQIQASSWAKFHQIVSGIGIALDIALIIYHALSLKSDKINTLTDLANNKENAIIKNKKNDFMISMAALQAVGNTFAMYFCRIILREPVYWRESYGRDNEETTVGLLKHGK